MKTLIAMHGLPRSGKSTITKKLAAIYACPIVNADAVRLALHGKRYEGLAEDFVKAIRLVMVRALFLAGHDVVLYDETNFSREIRNRIRSTEWRTVFVPVLTPPDVCKERAIATDQPDLVRVIDAMWARYEPLGADEDVLAVPEAVQQ